jgi:hypothetical protein
MHKKQNLPNSTLTFIKLGCVYFYSLIVFIFYHFNILM